MHNRVKTVHYKESFNMRLFSLIIVYCADCSNTVSSVSLQTVP